MSYRAMRNLLSVVAIAAVMAFVMFRLFGHPPKTTDSVPDGVRHIFNDAAQYEWNWMNWLVTDWVLTLLAAGTAITAAFKNAFSTHNQVQAQAAAAAAGNPAPVATSGSVDKWVMVFAALTIVATTLDSKMHASLQAERYRTGDLILQDAIMDYRIKEDKNALLESWHQAQKVLEGAPQTIDFRKNDKDKEHDLKMAGPQATTPNAEPEVRSDSLNKRLGAPPSRQSHSR